MIDISKQIHLVQSKDWNDFKKTYGTKVNQFEDMYFLVKKIPLSNKYMGYAPKVNFNVQKVDFEKLKNYCIRNNIAFIRFDVPNLLIGSKIGAQWNKKLARLCKKSPRNTFTKENIYLDISKSEDELLANMHQKRRYNIRYAIKKGVTIKIEQTDKAFNNFYKLHKQTSKRQVFLIHPKKYFETIYKSLKGNVYFIQAYVNKELSACWMVIINKETLYYPYGSSITVNNNFHPSDLVGFEAIKLGKTKGAKLFDMWGSEKGKGFTDFKLKYGAENLEYLPSYDFVINSLVHKQFNLMYQTFWKIQDIKKTARRLIN